MKILVTGGGGFVGNVVCRDLLEKGYEVRCIDNMQNNHCDPLIGIAHNKNFEFMKLDVANTEHCDRMMDGIDAVIHLAALVGFPLCAEKPDLAQIVNVGGTRNIVERLNGRRMVFASTGSVYGKIEGICDEDSPLNAVSEYGKNKLEAENIVSSTENTCSLRFATGFGISPNIRVNLLANDLTYTAMKQGIINVFEPEARRTFIHVRDMSSAFIFCLEKTDLKYNVYNVGDNNLNWTKRELAEYIQSKTNCFVHYAEFGKDLDQRDYEVSYKRINDEGWYTQVGMETGIDELIEASKIINIVHQYI